MLNHNQSREHYMAEHAGVIRDPVPMAEPPIPCRSCHQGKLGSIVDGKSSCNKCGRVHAFLVIRGKISYGVCL